MIVAWLKTEVWPAKDPVTSDSLLSVKSNAKLCQLELFNKADQLVLWNGLPWKRCQHRRLTRCRVKRSAIYYSNQFQQLMKNTVLRNGFNAKRHLALSPAEIIFYFLYYSYINLYIYIYIYACASNMIYKPAISFVLCTCSNWLSYLAYDVMCLIVYNINWPRILSHLQVDCNW